MRKALRCKRKEEGIHAPDNPQPAPQLVRSASCRNRKEFVRSLFTHKEMRQSEVETVRNL
jgi:hypothetical protein